MNIKPTKNNLVIKLIEQKTITESGLYIAPNEKEQIRHAEVLAVRPGIFTEDGERILIDIKVGDKVLLHVNSARRINIELQEYLIVNESNILAVIE